MVIAFLSVLQNPVLSQNLIKNSGFESGTLSPYWTSWPATSVIDNTNALEGSYCANLKSGEVYFSQPVKLEPNKTYRIKASIKMASSATVYFGISNVWNLKGTSIVFNNTNYKTDSLVFTTDENPGDNSEIYVWKDAGTSSIWIDNIVLLADPLLNSPEEPGGKGVYYVSTSGSDNNTGTSPSEAWKTIDKINKTDFEPGDQILFEGGETFIGTIYLNYNDNGTSQDKIQIGSYGNGRATINAQTKSGLIAFDCHDISIGNLNFTGNGRLDGNTGNGVVFNNCSNILVDGIEISGFQHSGLKLESTGENLKLKNVYSHNNGYAGIYVSGASKTAITNAYIGYCITDNNPGDPTVTDNHSGNGIFVYNASDIIIEYCEASYNGWDMPWNGNGPGGIWVAEVDSVIIQHCISHDNQTSSFYDGLGFDLDGGTTNSIIQYCLSYNNFGAGYGIFQYPGASNWSNNTIRYCISENDGNITGYGSVYIWNGTNNSNKLEGLEFYNNVIYNSKGSALAFYDHNNLDFNFRNNIFVSKSVSVHNGIKEESFLANCWYSLSGEFIVGAGPAVDFEAWAQTNNQEIYNGEIVGKYADPLLVNPGKSSITDPTKLTSLDSYKVSDGSIVTDAGLDLKSLFNIDPGTQDFFENQIKQGPAFDVGVFEKSQNVGHTAIYGYVSKTANRRAMPVTFSENAEIQSISIYHEGGTGNVLLGVYSDMSGKPSSLLGVTPLTKVNTTGGWQTITLASPVSVTSGQTVWLAWVFENTPRIRYETGTPGRASSADTWPAGMPSSFGTSSTANYIYSIYCSYNTKAEKQTTMALGDTTVFGIVSKTANRRAMPVYANENAEIQSISIYHEGGTGNVLLGVYSDISGKPSSLLGVTSLTNVSTTEGWQTIALTSPVSVISGQTVWLAWVFENTPGIRYKAGTPGRANSADTWTKGMPSSFGTSSTAGYMYSIYCNYILNNTKSANIALQENGYSKSSETKKFDLNVYPNPFNDKVHFKFTSFEDTYADLEIYNLKGQLIEKLPKQQILVGTVNHIEYKPRETIPEIYIYKLMVGENFKVGKIVYKGNK